VREPAPIAAVALALLERIAGVGTSDAAGATSL